MSSDVSEAVNNTNFKSQSLWNRAMSSDDKEGGYMLAVIGLNPFGTGQCLPTQKKIKKKA